MVAIMINEFLKLTVKSSGAEMISIRNCISNKEYLWQGDPNFWARRAPVLFPIVGKVKNNQYKFEGENYQLPQHGFARNMHFELIDKVENSLTYVLKNDDETAKVYPFKFELYIKYSLEDNKVIVSYEVKNTDSKTIWFVLGAHPAFNCPMEKNEKFTDYYLEFEKSETVSTKILSDGLVTDKETALLVNQQTLPLSKELFDNDALILENLKSRLVTLKSYKSTHQLSLIHI